MEAKIEAKVKEVLEKFISRQVSIGIFPGVFAFDIYTKTGYPVEMMQDDLKADGRFPQGIDMHEFRRLTDAHKSISRRSQKALFNH